MYTRRFLPMLSPSIQWIGQIENNLVILMADAAKAMVFTTDKADFVYDFFKSADYSGSDIWMIVMQWMNVSADAKGVETELDDELLKAFNFDQRGNVGAAVADWF